MKQTIEISWGSLWRIFIFVAFVAILYFGRQIVLGLFFAIIISSGLEGFIGWLEKIGLPRSISVILIFLSVILILMLLIYMLLPLAIVEINTILGTFGKTNSSFSFLSGFSGIKTISGFINQISSQICSNNSTPFNLFSSAFGGIGLALAVIISSFYLCLSKDGVERFLKVVVPPDYEESTLRIYEKSSQEMKFWFETQIFSSVIMGVLIWGGLTLLNVRYAFLIGVLGGVFEIIPFVGPFLSGALAVISALGTSTTLAIYTLIFFLIAQQFESNILIPIFNRRSIGLHPVIVIASVLIGAEVGGFLGVFVAIPAAAIFQEVITDWSNQKRSLRKSNL